MVVSSRGHADFSTPRRVLECVVQKIVDDLCQANRIGQDVQRFGLQIHFELVSSAFGERPRGVYGLTDQRRDLDLALAKLDAVMRDPAQIEQVVDEPYELLQLPLHRVERTGNEGALIIAAFQNLQRATHRRQGVAKLVRKRRQEFV